MEYVCMLLVIYTTFELTKQKRYVNVNNMPIFVHHTHSHRTVRIPRFRFHGLLILGPKGYVHTHIHTTYAVAVHSYSFMRCCGYGQIISL